MLESKDSLHCMFHSCNKWWTTPQKGKREPVLFKTPWGKLVILDLTILFCFFSREVFCLFLSYMIVNWISLTLEIRLGWYPKFSIVILSRPNIAIDDIILQRVLSSPAYGKDDIWPNWSLLAQHFIRSARWHYGIFWYDLAWRPQQRRGTHHEWSLTQRYFIKPN